MARTDRGTVSAFKAKSQLTKRQENDSRHRMMQRVSHISNRVADCAEGNVEMTMTQLKAADMILSRTVPTLSAAQILDGAENENLTRDEILARLEQMLENNPMLGMIAGITPKPIEGEVVDITEESDRDE